jgi:hypothetical protein
MMKETDDKIVLISNYTGEVYRSQRVRDSYLPLYPETLDVITKILRQKRFV